MKQCERCHLLNHDHATACQHCGGLSDIQLHEFLQNRQEQLVEIANLAKIFIAICIVIIALILFTV